jgi:excinuclease ABC subunit C
MPFSFTLSDYPPSPGVYLMKNAKGKIIYVGKAKSLRARLSSYFRSEAGHSLKTRAMVGQITAIDTLLTATEKEALLLEASLIKKHKPRYNVVLRDDKQYILFKLDKRHPFPRLRFTRRVERDGAAYFGPFTSAAAARKTWKELNRIFPLRKCSDRALLNRVRPCLYHHIGQCPAPCVNEVSREEYAETVRRVEDFLSGRSAEALRNIEGEMLAASEVLDFERAAKLRDLLLAMKKTVEGQAVAMPGFVDLDAAGIFASEEGFALCVLFVRQGRLLDAKSFVFAGFGKTDAAEAAISLLTQFYRPESFIPPRVLLQKFLLEGGGHSVAEGVEGAETTEGAGGAEGISALAEVLTERRGGSVRVAAPRGRFERRLMELALVNASRAIDEARARERETPLRLMEKLRLAKEPGRIEAVDVSHLGGRGTRVGQVVFEDGKPKKDAYRIYAFPELEGSADDYLALASWAKRRLKSGPPWPELVLVDGGKGQLAAVERAMAEAGGADLFALASIAKSGRGRAESGDQIFRPGRKNPMPLAPGSRELLFLQRLRDASHDFVLGSQRRSRKKAGLQSAVMDLPGVGPHTAKVLWERFGSVEDMAAATLDDLRDLPGFGPKKAAAVLAALSGIFKNA